MAVVFLSKPLLSKFQTNAKNTYVATPQNTLKCAHINECEAYIGDSKNARGSPFFQPVFQLASFTSCASKSFPFDAK